LRPRVLVWQWGRRGGGPRYTLEVVRALVTDPGLELRLSLSRQSELWAQFTALGLPGFHIDTYHDRASAIIATARLPSLRRRFARYLREERIDVVYCTMTHHWNAAIAPVIGLSGARYLFTAHDATLHPGERIPGRQWLLSAEIRSADGIIALTDHVARAALRAHRTPVPVWRIPLAPFDLSGQGERRPSSGGAPARTLRRPVRLLFFGRLLAYKGVDLLLQALRILLARGVDAELAIVGEGAVPPLPAGLDPGRVRVDNRWISDDEVAGVFERADILVLPYREASQSGFAGTAQLLGVPIVATPVGGLAEQVHHLETGVVADAVSASALADALALLIADAELYARCSRESARSADPGRRWAEVGATVAGAIRQLAIS